MPHYAFLAERAARSRPTSPTHLRANRAVGVPYTDEMIANAAADLLAQADPDADTAGAAEALSRRGDRRLGGEPAAITEMDALVAYLQVLGTMVNFGDVTPDDLQQ